MILTGALALQVGLLLLKIHHLHRAARELGEAFRDRLAEDTNILVDTGSHDPYMRSLASEVNAGLRALRRDRRRFRQGDMELKDAVTHISHDLRTPLTAICGYLEKRTALRVFPPLSVGDRGADRGLKAADRGTFPVFHNRLFRESAPSGGGVFERCFGRISLCLLWSLSRLSDHSRNHHAGAGNLPKLG